MKTIQDYASLDLSKSELDEVTQLLTERDQLKEILNSKVRSQAAIELVKLRAEVADLQTQVNAQAATQAATDSKA